MGTKLQPATALDTRAARWKGHPNLNTHPFHRHGQMRQRTVMASIRMGPAGSYHRNKTHFAKLVRTALTYVSPTISRSRPIYVTSICAPEPILADKATFRLALYRMQSQRTCPLMDTLYYNVRP